MPEAYRSIIKLAREAHPGGRISVQRIGSLVNDVFLVEADTEKFVAKQYTNWLSLKWLTLSIYGIGSVNFSISGRKRMEAEFAVNRLLSDQGVRVRRVVGVDFPSRVILFTYVPGDEYSRLMRKVAKASDYDDREKLAAFSIGETMAVTHSMDLSIGDTRPDNFIVDRKGEATLLDLEQAKRGGDPAWDVAEFLYFSGHYWLSYNKTLARITDEFVNGYLNVHGTKAILRYAASARYLRLFSIWTPPFVLSGIRHRLLQA